MTLTEARNYYTENADEIHAWATDESGGANNHIRALASNLKAMAAIYFANGADDFSTINHHMYFSDVCKKYVDAIKVVNASLEEPIAKKHFTSETDWICSLCGINNYLFRVMCRNTDCSGSRMQTLAAQEARIKLIDPDSFESPVVTTELFQSNLSIPWGYGEHDFYYERLMGGKHEKEMGA